MKSWSAIAGRLASRAQAVVAIDLAQVRQLPVVRALKSRLLETFPDLATLEAYVDRDLFELLDDAVMVLCEDHAVFVLGLADKDEEQFVAWLQAGVQAEQPWLKVFYTRGEISEYWIPSDDRFYAAWLAPQVVAFTDEPDNRAQLAALLAKAPQPGDLDDVLAETDTTTFAWLACSDHDIQRGRLTIALAGEIVVVNAKFLAAPTDAGQHMVRNAELELAVAMAQAAGQPSLREMLAGIELASAGDTLSLELRAPVAELPTVIRAVVRLFDAPPAGWHWFH
jgi:hypothetical protein